MTLRFILLLVAWVFFLIPITAFFAISLKMIIGAGKDDEMIHALSLLGFTFFLIGAVMLMLLYTTLLV